MLTEIGKETGKGFNHRKHCDNLHIQMLTWLVLLQFSQFVLLKCFHFSSLCMHHYLWRACYYDNWFTEVFKWIVKKVLQLHKNFKIETQWCLQASGQSTAIISLPIFLSFAFYLIHIHLPVLICVHVFLLYVHQKPGWLPLH